MNQLDDNIYNKFPCVIKKKLLSQQLKFPEKTKFEYEPILAYRCIERKVDDYTLLNRNDFLSNVEELLNKGKKITKKRGQTVEPENDINYYGTSFSTTRESLANVMHLPRPLKKVCFGHVYMEGGPQLTEGQHINWWIFEYADLKEFSIE